MKIRAVEGNRFKLDGGAMFGHVPKTLWQQWLKPDESNRIEMACRCLLLQLDDGRNFLFEAGVGSFFEPRLKDRYQIIGDPDLLIENLSKIGIEETDIDGVILSHLHFDHAGGLLPSYGDEGPPRLHFPSATYYVGKRHWEAVLNPHPREKSSFVPIIQELLEGSGRLELVENGTHKDLDFGVTFHFSDGHTEGMMLSEIATDDGPVLFASDLVPGSHWVHLPVIMSYDRFSELKVDEKKQIYDPLIAKGGSLFFTHDPSISQGKLIQDEDGKYQLA